jgi:dihydroneopterin aldolase
VSGAVDPPPAIELRGLRVLGVHGALAEERARAQPFELDLDISGDFGAAAASDRLADTADYAVLAAQAAHVVATTTFWLLEALARAVGLALLEADARVQAVAVTVRKVRPPVALDLDSAGVRLVVRRV